MGVSASEPVMSRTPSAMASASHFPRSCSASGTSAPSARVRAGRRASVSSISASRPVTSPFSGRRPWSCLVSLIASDVRSTRLRDVPELAV
jgi:hypothetical protein